MGVLIDASVLIEFERGNLDLPSMIAGREDQEFLLSVVTASELLHGAHRAREPGTRARRSAWVEAVLDRFPLLDVDLSVARAHARLWSDLASEGRLIGPHDLWLAASCLAHGLVLATSNLREFERVQGLRAERWSSVTPPGYPGPHG